MVFVGNHPTCGDAPTRRGEPARRRTRDANRSTACTSASSRRSWRWCSRSPPSTRARSSFWSPAFRRRSAGSTTTSRPIVHVTNSSQELGNAVADVLFGDYNPGGRTTTTWYQSETDIPTDDHRLRHQEGDHVLVLHRRAAVSVRPRPVVRDVRVCEPDAERRRAAGGVRDASTSGVDVTNTSAVDGDEVVQLYVSLSRLGRAAAAAAAARLPARHHRRRRDRARDAVDARRPTSPTGTRTPGASGRRRARPSSCRSARPRATSACARHLAVTPLTDGPRPPIGVEPARRRHG